MRLLKRLNLQFISMSLILVTFSACDKRMDEQVQPVKLSIAGKLATSADFSLIQAAVVQSGLQNLLDSPGSYTFFAPSNGAMLASGMTLEQIKSTPASQLRKMITYHLLPLRLFLNDFKTNVYYNEITIGGDTAFVIKNDQGLFVNGIKIEQTDLLQKNGIIHSTSLLLKPANGDLMEVVSEDTSLSMFHAALLRTANGGTDLTNALVCGCKFTLFAPTNSAFKFAGYPDAISIENADYKKIVALLSYHISKERVFASDWTNQMAIHMINGRNIQIIENGNQMMIKGSANLSPIKVLKFNTMAHHGVIHTIERILE
jgi:uncharacterized surface protein with fasciclin (FAS1) repeats